MKSLFNAMILASLLLFSVSAMAADEPNPCGELKVQIVSLPQDHCVLINTIIDYGMLVKGTSVPVVVTMKPASFVMRQTTFGPDIELRYLCNGTKTINIETQQNLCLLRGGHITTKSDTPSVHASVVEGSYLWGIQGTVTWVL